MFLELQIRTIRSEGKTFADIVIINPCFSVLEYT